jgi:SAM-dependent methyltransferase
LRVSAPAALDAMQADVASYYGAKIARHGPTPFGVDWTCEPTQQLRFVQLLKVTGPGRFFTLNDLGCGYGALLPFLRQRRLAREFDYLGIDVAPAMIDAARALHGRRRNARFECSAAPSRVADFTVASGIFNVRFAHGDDAWSELVERTLRTMADCSRLAFAVNFIDASVGRDMPGQLYRADADEWRAWCEKELGWRCEVLRGYGMREFTLHCFRGPVPAAYPAPT